MDLRHRGQLLLALATLAVATACVLPGSAQAQAACATGTASYSFTGGEDCYEVPAGVHSLQVEATGAPGAGNTPDATAVGGLGAIVTGTVAVTPGQTLYVNVGGPGQPAAGGFNGGGNGITSSVGGFGTSRSGGGGGGTDLRTCSRSAVSCPSVTTLGSRLIIAGGGGGAGAVGSQGGGTGGGGGGSALNGQSGVSSSGVIGGAGGTQSAGGAGGGNPCSPGVVVASESGELGEGGTGGYPTTFGNASGGGGGGGYYGGGGGGPWCNANGAGAGGGGGSSFSSDPSATFATATSSTPSLKITPGVPEWTLTVTKAGSGDGTVLSAPPGINCGVACSERYPEGTVVSLSATPTADSYVDGFSGGCLNSSPTVCDVRVDQAKTIEVNFTSRLRTLNVVKNGSGGGSVASSPAGINCGADCSEDFVDGTVVTLTASPDADSEFGAFSSNCAPVVGNVNACTVTADAARTVTVTFARRVAPPPTTVDTTITRVPSKPRPKRIHFNFEASDPSATFACQFDDLEPEPCSSPKFYRHLERGRHRFAVTATADGQTDPTPASVRFRVTGGKR